MNNIMKLGKIGRMGKTKKRNITKKKKSYKNKSNMNGVNLQNNRYNLNSINYNNIQNYNQTSNGSNKNNDQNNSYSKVGGGPKTCMCVDFEKKDGKFINYKEGVACNRPVVRNTNFCEKHQDCMGFVKQFMNDNELPYNPDEWNNDHDIINTHNCYTYFLNKKIGKVASKCKELSDKKRESKCKDLKPQPGDFYTIINEGTLRNRNPKYTCKDMKEKVLNDNPSIEETTFDRKCPTGSYKGALVVDRNNTYHFYRQNADGTWSHKPGTLKVTDVDASGNKIYFPHLADRNYRKGEKKSSGVNYNDFCNYLCVPKKEYVNLYAI
jgi:hypothetical protein